MGSYRCGPYRENMYEYLLFDHNCLSTSATTVKRECLEKAGMFSEEQGFQGLEDYELWLRLSKTCKFYFLHEILGEYRIGEGGFSRNIEKKVRNEINVIEHHFAMSGLEEKDNWKRKRRYARVYTSIGWSSLHRFGRFEESREWYHKAITEYPFFYLAYAALLLSFLRVKW